MFLWRHPEALLLIALAFYQPHLVLGALLAALTRALTLFVSVVPLWLLLLALSGAAVIVSWRWRLWFRDTFPAFWHRRREVKREGRDWSNAQDRRAIIEDFQHWCADSGFDIPVKVIGWRTIAAGQEWKLRTPNGMAVKAALERALPHIFARPNVLEVRPTWVDLTTVTVEVRSKDPLKNAAPLRHTATLSRDVLEPIPIGRDEEGRAVTLSFYEQHTLAAGKTRSGKTNFIRSMLIAAATSTNGELHTIVDPKGDLAMWQPACRIYSNGDPATALRALQNVLAEQDRRSELLRTKKLQKILPGAETPLLVVVVDEVPTLVASKTYGKDIAACIIDIAQRGAGFAIHLILGVQHQRDDMIPVPAAQQMSQVLCFRMRSPQGSDLVLGAGMARDGFDASRITRPGQCFLTVNGSDPERVQTVEVEPSTEAKILEGFGGDSQGGSWGVREPLEPPFDDDVIGPEPDGEPLPDFVTQDVDRLRIWRELVANPEGVQRKELARRLGMNETTLLRRLREMAHHGLVEGGEGEPWVALPIHPHMAS